MSLLTATRIVAVGLSLATFVFLFLHDSFRSDNLFLVPDLVLCTALVVAAALPGRFAVPALIAAFGMTCGVLATSASSYAVDGELGFASLLGLTTSVAMTVLLAHHGRQPARAAGLNQG